MNGNVIAPGDVRTRPAGTKHPSPSANPSVVRLSP